MNANSPPPDIRLLKHALRREAELRRAKFHTENPGAAAALRDTILKSISFPASTVVAAYYPRGTEIDPLPLLQALDEQGVTLALPIIESRNAPLTFRRYQPGDNLARALFGTSEPLNSAPVVEPDIIFVPLLAFDRAKGRLGYGGGYYDRTINQLRQRKPLLVIGIGYSGQEVPEIPMGSFDARLDKIATELQVF